MEFELSGLVSPLFHKSKKLLETTELVMLQLGCGQGGNEKLNAVTWAHLAVESQDCLTHFVVK